MIPSKLLRLCRYTTYIVFVLLVVAIVVTFLDERKVSKIRQTLNISGSANLLMLGRVRGMLDESKKSRVLQWRGEWVENEDVCDLTRPPLNVVSYRLHSGKTPFVIYGVGKEENDSLSQKMVDLSYKFSMKVDDYISVYLENFPSTVFIDIGASIGVTSLRMARNGHDVIAVESDYDNVRGLCMSIAENGATDSVRIVYHSVGEEVMSFNEDKHSENIITVDRILTLSNRNLLVKIDTDGSEHSVLLGSKYLLMNKRTRAIVLAWETHKGQRSGEILLSLFSTWGFMPHAFRGSGAVRLDMKGHAPSTWPSDVIWLPTE